MLAVGNLYISCFLHLRRWSDAFTYSITDLAAEANLNFIKKEVSACNAKG